MIEPGTTNGSGWKNSNSKYSKFKILKIFSLLYKTKLTYPTIGKKYGVPRSTVEHIANGRTHKWLMLEYPEEFAKIFANRNR